MKIAPKMRTKRAKRRRKLTNMSLRKYRSYKSKSRCPISLLCAHFGWEKRRQHCPRRLAGFKKPHHHHHPCTLVLLLCRYHHHHTPTTPNPHIYTQARWPYSSSWCNCGVRPVAGSATCESLSPPPSRSCGSQPSSQKACACPANNSKPPTPWAWHGRACTMTRRSWTSGERRRRGRGRRSFGMACSAWRCPRRRSPTDGNAASWCTTTARTLSTPTPAPRVASPSFAIGCVTSTRSARPRCRPSTRDQKPQQQQQQQEGKEGTMRKT